MKKIITNILISSLLVISIQISTIKNFLPVQATSNTVSYITSTANISNPERGYFSQLSFTDDEVHTFTNQDLIDFKAATGLTVFRIYYFIPAYLASDLPQSLLSKINNDATIFRQAGLKLMPTFTYSPNGTEPDATAAQISRHLDQLSPYFNNNKDVIAAVYSGFVGAYGEWHDSLAGNLGQGLSTNNNSITIIDKR